MFWGLGYFSGTRENHQLAKPKAETLRYGGVPSCKVRLHAIPELQTNDRCVSGNYRAIQLASYFLVFNSNIQLIIHATLDPPPVPLVEEPKDHILSLDVNVTLLITRHRSSSSHN
jgi:hypothetical protein